ncbi:MAG: PAS domain-containing protein [Pirellulales bacterium]|nr:PAS domain-containing protein [Pirellulales bacterium]
MTLNKSKSSESDATDHHKIPELEIVTVSEGNVPYSKERPVHGNTEARKQTEKVLGEEEQQQLNELLLDALPHFAMLIRKDRTVLAANREAREAGAIIGGYCWQDFGHCNFIPEEDKIFINDHKCIPPGGTNCDFCIADEALETQTPTNDPELHAWGKIWDVYWVPLNREVYLHYAIDITGRKLADQLRQKVAKDLTKRVEELNCLYGLSKLVETPGIKLEGIFQGMVDLIPNAWQFPEITCARLIFEGKQFTTDNFQETPWRQSADIEVQGERSGNVEVFYKREVEEYDEGPFLKEERHLLDAITERLGKIINRMQSEETLRKSKDLLEITVQQRTSELRNNEENLAEAQRIAHLGNWVWDIGSNELFWSDEVYRIFGFQPQEMAASYTDFLGCVHPDDRKQVADLVNLAINVPETDYNIDHRIIRPDGTERIVHEHGKVTFDLEDKPVRMIGTVHDVTEQKKLEREILHCSTHEQRRIGQELHDGLGQELTGLNYIAKSLHNKLQAKGAEESEIAAELAEGIPKVVGQLQAIVKGLVPLEVDGRDLVPALLELAENVQERTGISCRFEGRGRVRVTDDNTAIQLYRIAQEAVNNAVKHGQPEKITLSLTCKHNQIKLKVCDDGIGIGPDMEKVLGSGLRIMKYRAGVIGGRFEIKQRADGGTLVTCTLPMKIPNGCGDA